MPNFRLEYVGISMPTSLSWLKVGGGGASDSFQSESPKSSAFASPEAPRTQASRTTRLAWSMQRVAGRGRLIRKIGIRIGIEAGAGRQLENRFVPRSRRVSLEFAGAHVASQEAVAKVLSRQVA